MYKNKKVRLYIDGKRQKDVPLYMTKFQTMVYRVRMFVGKVVRGMLVIATLVGAVWFGSQMFPTTQAVEVIKEVEVVNSDLPPILLKIANCESGGNHYDKSGQVLLTPNKYSVDIGIFQINDEHWGKKATEMGLNLMNEQDNIKFALWLFQNRGSVDWYLSSSCWNK